MFSSILAHTLTFKRDDKMLTIHKTNHLITRHIYLTVLQAFLALSVDATKMNSGNSDASVIVVGGGLAGLSASIEASRLGAKVTIIEKEKNLGGNSAKATSGINGVGTDAQSANKVTDSIDAFVSDTLSSGDGLSKEELVQVLGEKSGDAITFLKSFGVNLTSVVQLGGHSAARTHRIPPTPEGKPSPVGWTIVSTLRKVVENELADKVNVLTKSTLKTILIEDGTVKGVAYTTEDGEQKELAADAVILTAGGYANDHTETSLLAEYTPQLAKLPTTNGPWATGDVVKIGRDAGMSLIHMDKVQVHPTGFIEPTQPTHSTKFLAPEALRGCGAILLNKDGARFANELGRRDYLTEKIFGECSTYPGIEDGPTTAVMLMNKDVIDKFGAPSAGFYKFKKIIQDVGTLEDVATKLELSPEVLKKTLSEYEESSQAGKDQFGKTVFPVVFSETDHFLTAFITPTLHYCMGGIEINPSAQVLNVNKEVVPGLYAAGEVSGGVHGNNRLGGNSLLECTVFGRIAGINAAKSKSSRSDL
ncbi:unnamed protein product [Owenia fusiformis]|uniref:fumarate reductase (NADH) n=1 Tax=Owenia fusiformis TaxID=6347 RepID=A0A8S4Q363_OWEFU|nr:unnamed protein product [Owenia fusiformis]